ncbi:MAG: hypothetical protein M1814_000062 [Vezdaea aestivalis]|nr:MAG: hypothetical protein M1814_000062 [Vezdaea aestivalis]
MTEVTFAKQFLTTISSKPQKIEPNHVEDPSKLPARSAMILPKMPRLPHKPAPITPGAERSINVTIKSLRPPVLAISLPSQPFSTTIGELKALAASKSSLTPAQLRLLLNKRPLSDSKTLRETLGTEDSKTSIEFTAMIIGGGPSTPEQESARKQKSGEGFADVDQLNTKEFWRDLRGFLLQRLKNERQADDLCGLFEDAFKEREKAI